ncbi:hypothetical protein TNCT_575751 [Trichonephila clavata]|uniref:Uncharacterized protein n=1 Tax=Trichonephila clavata TaxID=2740835 RepID=A0A8X6FUX6_TRICU|nr:hypothetical protein TNCT_575751 [Trichonephila clavata]
MTPQSLLDKERGSWPRRLFSLPSPSPHPFEFLKGRLQVWYKEISLESLQQGNQNYGFASSNNGYGRPRNSQRNRKSNFRRGHQSRRPAQSPAQYQYITLLNLLQFFPQVLPKEIEIFTDTSTTT